MKRNSFVFYRSFYEAIKKLKKTEQLTLYSYICRYALGEEVENLEGVPEAIFDLIKPQIDANTKRYEGGLKGGRPVTKAKPSGNHSKTITYPNVNANDNENENVNDNDNANANASGSDEAGQAEIPSFKEVCDEVHAQGYSVSAMKFFEYYQKNGWKTTEGEPVRNWRTMLRIWDMKERGETPAAMAASKKRGKNSFNNFEQRDYTEAELEAMLLEIGG